ncbi:MAG: hypothetical protein GXY80_13155 [Syntrophorhabdus aromaticivorans]|uniref:Uncharacterized protein n=2 Tax=Syntrophorhabdus aromaticivorans TaxID=328301 RepID=A0A971M5G9_9BACT|nr:hypothetical protein [Syntrophorhabdus aromaticivorans]
MEKLTGTLKQLREPWDLHTVDGGGDHSFRVPKTAGMQDEGIFARLVSKTLGRLSSSGL